MPWQVLYEDADERAETDGTATRLLNKHTGAYSTIVDDPAPTNPPDVAPIQDYDTRLAGAIGRDFAGLENGLWQPGDPIPGSTPEEIAAGAPAPAGPSLLDRAGGVARSALDATGLQNRDVLPVPGLGVVPPGIAAKAASYLSKTVPPAVGAVADRVGGFMSAPIGGAAPAKPQPGPTIAGAPQDLPEGTKILKAQVGFEGEKKPALEDPFKRAERGLDIEAAGQGELVGVEARNKDMVGQIRGDVRAGLIDNESERSRIVTETGAKLTAFREKFATQAVDPNRYVANRDTWQNVLSAVGVALGAFASGYRGGPNQAYQMILDTIDRDVRAQEADRENTLTLYNMARQEMGDDLDALAVSKATMLEVAQAATDEILASGAADEQAANLKILAGKLEQAKAQLYLGMLKGMKGAGGEKLPAEQASKLGGYLSAIEGAEDVYAKFKTLGASRYLQNVPVLSWLPTAGKRFEMYKQAQVRDLVHALSGADAPEKQFENFVQMFSAAGDLPGTAEAKQEALQKFLRGRYYHTVTALDAAGYDVKRFPQLQRAAQGYVPGEFEDFLGENPEIAEEFMAAAEGLGGVNAPMRGILDAVAGPGAGEPASP